MKVSGQAVLGAPVERVWEALLDPDVLVRTIPGCEKLEVTGENSYAMLLTAGVASVRGTYAGTCELQDLRPHDSLTLKATGAGTPGTIAADVRVSFTDNGDGTTTLTYDADATVGGMIGGVGQRMLTSATKRMAAEFFAAVEAALDGAGQAAGEVASPTAAEPTRPAGTVSAPAAGRTFLAPPRPAAGGADFVRGALFGAGLVLAGVAAGALASRRRG